ncbi:putative small t antigen [Finch polyomavirus]|uniref:Putative Small T antigen n=1 Tax=Gammapolyomavirus pypyrrhula TaxID=1891751 RepID=A0A2I6RKA7_9POLY|nr:putative small t antigen [Finch polyomavirus]ABB04273.1 putative small t antigen [Gammapolyomavirus pypyrrhula]AUN86667.1 putative small T antigen [Gammapolyomavirus pypyrrhula]AUN86673.1 putative small T antigen [Gammapolyomavirus pypyrrhula]AUN86679.1 putative small T antigen [Gammapolyomavirus pypyrrhula]
MSTLQKLIDLLGLPPSATEADVRSAYRKKALEFHPDKGGDPERMKELNRLMDEFRHSQSLFCDETLDSDSDDGDSPGPSQRTSTPEPGTGKDSGHGTFEPEVNSWHAIDYDRAYCRLMELKWCLESFFTSTERRKQGLTPEYLELKRRFQAVPWRVFDNVFNMDYI